MLHMVKCEIKREKKYKPFIFLFTDLIVKLKVKSLPNPHSLIHCMYVIFVILMFYKMA